MTREELQKANPELMSALIEEGRQTGIAEGITMERNRIKDLDDITMDGYAEMIADAKYGEKPRTASEISIEMVKQMSKTGQAAQGQSFMDKRRVETVEMSNVGGQAHTDNDEDTALDRDIEEAVAMAKDMRPRA